MAALASACFSTSASPCSSDISNSPSSSSTSYYYSSSPLCNFRNSDESSSYRCRRRPESLFFGKSLCPVFLLNPSSWKESLSSRCPPLQVRAAGGYYPASITWWKKGDQPNMHEIHSAEEFTDALKKAGDKLVLVEFYSAGCRSCKALYPKICQIAADNPDIKVLKVNFYDNLDLCRSLNVSMMPFFHIYRGVAGRVDAFSCSLSRINKLREAVAKHKGDRVKVPVTVNSSKQMSNDVLVTPTPVLATVGSPS